MQTVKSTTSPTLQNSPYTNFASTNIQHQNMDTKQRNSKPDHIVDTSPDGDVVLIVGLEAENIMNYD
jgi:hypothetical protein